MPQFINEEYLLKYSHNLLTFGNHTKNHYVISSLNEKEQCDEIKDFENFFHEKKIKRSKVFSLPFGGDKDFDSSTLKILHDEGYEAILMSRGRLCRNNLLFKNLQITDRVMPRRGDVNVNLGTGYVLSFRNTNILSN